MNQRTAKHCLKYTLEMQQLQQFLKEERSRLDPAPHQNSELCKPTRLFKLKFPHPINHHGFNSSCSFVFALGEASFSKTSQIVLEPNQVGA